MYRTDSKDTRRGPGDSFSCPAQSRTGCDCHVPGPQIICCCVVADPTRHSLLGIKAKKKITDEVLSHGFPLGRHQPGVDSRSSLFLGVCLLFVGRGTSEQGSCSDRVQQLLQPRYRDWCVQNSNFARHGGWRTKSYAGRRGGIPPLPMSSALIALPEIREFKSCMTLSMNLFTQINVPSALFERVPT